MDVSPRTTPTQAIKDLILSQGLRPGDPLPTESELVELLGISRATLREAVRTLVALDLVEVRHGKGTFVGQMSMRPFVEAMAFRGVLMPGDGFGALREVVDVRMALDLALAPRTIERLAGHQAPALELHCRAMEEQSARGETFAAADRAFHLGLAEILGNRLYGELVAAFWDVHGAVGPRLGIPTPRDIADTVAAHRDMLHTAVAGDLEGYQRAVRAHYAPLQRVLQSSEAHLAG